MNGEGTASPGVLETRVAQGPADWAVAHQMLEEDHLLGAGREAGDRLCQFVLEDGQPVAVLVWCAAAWHLKDRDERIGWDAETRSQQLKLVVQLRRFLVVNATRSPNFASQCLGLALRGLCGAWSCEFGYRPLLAKSFSDPESHAGTVYITADPLHNKQATVRVIMEKGGDYLIGTKDNTPKRQEAAVDTLRGTPFLQ